MKSKVRFEFVKVREPPGNRDVVQEGSENNLSDGWENAGEAPELLPRIGPIREDNDQIPGNIMDGRSRAN